MADLFMSLVADFIEKNRSPEMDPLTADEKLQWIEAGLNDATQGETTAEAEKNLLISYLELGGAELQALPPAVHEWFLERWAISGPWTREREELDQLANHLSLTYFAAGPGSYQFACVSALLVFDESNRRETETSYLSGVWNRILDAPHLADDEKRESLLPLIDALLDLTRLAVESDAASKALRALLRRDVKSGYVAEVTTARAKLFGEPYAKGLLALLFNEEK